MEREITTTTDADFIARLRTAVETITNKKYSDDELIKSSLMLAYNFSMMYYTYDGFRQMVVEIMNGKPDFSSSNFNLN